MTEFSTNQNIKAHYTSEAKVKRPSGIIATAPDSLPSNIIYNDREATKKMASINQDIYLGTKKENNKNTKTFIKYFIGTVIAIASFIGLKKLFKKS